MKAFWLIADNHLAVKYNNEIFHPNAEEMYKIIWNFSNSFVFGMECMPVQKAFSKMHFSKIGTDIKCKLETNVVHEILIELYCIRNGEKVSIDVINGQIIDQCVFQNEWFYITGSIVELQEVFEKAAIKKSGKITISQYIEILKKEDNFVKGTLINKVKVSLLDKPVDNNDKLIPSGLCTELYNYQKTGYFWMRYMMLENKGCILGDEMGLGKTLQIITLMLNFKYEKKVPMLVIAPVSLLQNWKNECEKFAPSIKVLVHHGTKRTGYFKEIQKYDVVVMSYNTAVSDLSILNMINWNLLVLDEAQNIKNPESNRAKFIKKISRQASIAVTGTPFENHVMDIWSLVDFIKPGLLGSQAEYASLISDDANGAKKIEPLLTPIMIRRSVKNVAQDLPQKVVIPQPLKMSEIEAKKYEDYRMEVQEKKNSKKINLGIIQKLRMFCAHSLICGELVMEDPIKNSIKYQRMCELIEEIRELNEKVILFTSYQKMFDILDKDIPERFKIPVFKINGKTPVNERQNIVNMFNSVQDSAMLVLNPRAAGTGLNITSANHVIHYNLEWNPSLEDQASARAYRRGQKKTVFVYRLFYTDTVEEIINDRIERKREIAKIAVVGTSGKMQNKKDIIKALSISPMKEKNL